MKRERGRGRERLGRSVGAGKAVISTPYRHAKELLANNRGILVPFANSTRIGEAVNLYLSDQALMTATRKRAWKLGARDDLAGRGQAAHGELRTCARSLEQARAFIFAV